MTMNLLLELHHDFWHTLYLVLGTFCEDVKLGKVDGVCVCVYICIYFIYFLGEMIDYIWKVDELSCRHPILRFSQKYTFFFAKGKLLDYIVQREILGIHDRCIWYKDLFWIYGVYLVSNKLIKNFGNDE